MGFLNKLVKILVGGDPARPKADTAPQGVLLRQGLLDALFQQFAEGLRLETTTESLAFPTSYTVYLRQEDYDRLADSFQLTCKDAVKLYLREIEKHLKKYPDFAPLSRYWTFQLVAMPEGILIDGVSQQEMEDSPVIIRSSILSRDDYDDGGAQSQGRVVTTFRSVSSVRALPKGLNLAALRGVDQLEKDKFRIKFDPDNQLGLSISVSPIGQPANDTSAKPVAVISAVEGSFIADGQRFASYRMTQSALQISGRNAPMQRGVATLTVDSEMVLAPHCIIQRDPASETFYITAHADIRLNERSIARGTRKLLPFNSRIILCNGVEIKFSKP